MRYYLIKQWFPHRGQTSEEPSCYFCGGYTYEHPLTIVKKNLCYKSRKRAERVAEKYRSLYSRVEVVEVPESIVKEDGDVSDR